MKTIIISTAGLMFLMLVPERCMAQNWSKNILRTSHNGTWTRTADFNQDQKPDILVQGLDSLFWYENLQPGWNVHFIDSMFNVSTFDNLGYVEVGDLDGDGDFDILQVPGRIQSEIVWNENQANGSQWTRHVIQASVNRPGNPIRSFGDLDQDGDIDHVMPFFGEGKLVWLEKQPGSWISHTIEISRSYRWSTVGDMDGDNDLDIIAGGISTAPHLGWFENTLPDTSWQRHTISSDSIVSSTGAVADLDGDHDLDLVTGDNLNTNLVYFKNPTWDTVTIATGKAITATGIDIWMGPIGDIDNDQDLDISFGDFFHSFGWVENKGTNSSWAIHKIDTVRCSGVSCSLHFPTGIDDIDGDGDMDLVAFTILFHRFGFPPPVGNSNWYANPAITTAIDEVSNHVIPHLAAYPNPFTRHTTLSYTLARTAGIEIEIYDALGRKIVTLLNQPKVQGNHELIWEGTNAQGISMKPGIYLCRLRAEGHSTSLKMVLNR